MRYLTAPAVTAAVLVLAVMLALVVAVAILGGTAFAPAALLGLVP